VNKKTELASSIIEEGFIIKTCFKKLSPCKKTRYSENNIDIESYDIINKDVLSDIDYCINEIRRNLKKYCLRTSWGYFIRKDSLEEWKLKNDDLSHQYRELLKKIGIKYDFIINDAKKNCRKEIQKTFKKELPDSSVQQIINQVVDRIPNREEFVSSFSYNFYILKINVNEFSDEEKSIYIETFINEATVNFKKEISIFAKYSHDALIEYNKITMRLIRWIRNIFEKNKNINFFNEDIDKIINEIKDTVRKRRAEINLEELKLLLKKLII
jgi:hypothetical protein